MLKIDTLDRLSPVFSFTVASGRMAITDPCYEPGTWCAHQMDVPNGEWRVKLGYNIDQDDLDRMDHWIAEREKSRDGFPDDKAMKWVIDIDIKRLQEAKAAYTGRVAVQMAWLSTAMSDERAEQLIKNSLPGFEPVPDAGVGVDSGQAGFFDCAQYIEQGSYKYDSPVYSAICALTCDKGDMGGAVVSGDLTFGSVSSTGYGDGGYPLYALTEGGQIVALAIVFMQAAEDEEEPDDADGTV
jgi:hypothetical protein